MFCGLGEVLSRPMDGYCDSRGSGLVADPQDTEDYNNNALEEDVSGQEQEAECAADPKAKGAERKDDAGEDKKEAENANSDKFQEQELEGDSVLDKRESRYQLNDYQSAPCEDQDVAKYRDAFGGFPQDSGRGKRVKRSFLYH